MGNGGWCLKVIENRIYGSMQLSQSLLNYAGDWLNTWKMVNVDLVMLEAYSRRLQVYFKDAFANCAKGSCIGNKFCKSLVQDQLFDTDENLTMQLLARCKHEAWR